MARSLPCTVLMSSLFSSLCVVFWMPQAVFAAPRDSFPGRRVGGGTRGECAARPIVHLVPSSSVFAPGDPSVIALLEGPSSNPQPVEIVMSAASADGGFASSSAPLLQRELPGAKNRLVLLSLPSSKQALRWESSYLCGQGGASDEFGFITASAPPALSLLVPGTGDREDRNLQQVLANLQESCGGTAALQPLKTALQLDDDVIDDSWPQQVTVQCF